MPKLTVRTLLAALTVTALALVLPVATAGPASAHTKVSQASAENQLRGAGISWSSSGNCTYRYASNCTSFDQINQETLNGVMTLKRASGCGINITGGTEVGHAGGTYSHFNGYKVDVATSTTVTTCIDRYIRANFPYIGTRADGAKQYRSAAGNVYANEWTHWDITYY